MRFRPRRPSFGFPRNRLARPLLATVVLSACVGAAAVLLPEIARCADELEGARQAALDYIDHEFRRAEKEPGYWQSSWGVDVDLVRDRIRLGRPYRVGKILPQDLESFATTGALRPTYGYTLHFPVYHEERRIKLVLVREDNGVWTWVGRADGRSALFNMAVEKSTEATDVSIIMIKGLGGLMILAPTHGGPKKVIPLSDAKEHLHSLADTAGFVPYDAA